MMVATAQGRPASGLTHVRAEHSMGNSLGALWDMYRLARLARLAGAILIKGGHGLGYEHKRFQS